MELSAFLTSIFFTYENFKNLDGIQVIIKPLDNSMKIQISLISDKLIFRLGVHLTIENVIFEGRNLHLVEKAPDCLNIQEGCCKDKSSYIDFYDICNLYKKKIKMTSKDLRLKSLFTNLDLRERDKEKLKSNIEKKKLF